MEAKIVDKNTYRLATRNIINAYNKDIFTELNRSKVQDILYIIVYKESSPRFGVAFGEKNGYELYCPFSAPFGYIEPLKKEQSVANYEEALTAIESLLQEQGYTQATITLPPDFYHKNVIDTWYSIMLNRGWAIDYVDLSFGIHLPTDIAEYEQSFSYNAKKNYKIALRSNLSLHECVSTEDKKEAYRIIQKNRSTKGYPLRMTEDQVLDTMQVVPSHMYLVSCDEKNLAAALVYDVTETIAQVIYWGDIDGGAEKKVINYLAHELVNIYSGRGFQYLDIGPSTENGIPNHGLCDFKDSIGCVRSAKFRLTKRLS